jgi:hypothetical protein
MPPGVLLTTSRRQVLEPGVAPDFEYSVKQSVALAPNATNNNANAARKRHSTLTGPQWSLQNFILLPVVICFANEGKTIFRESEIFLYAKFPNNLPEPTQRKKREVIRAFFLRDATEAALPIS